jgi:hypothetical protein
LSASVYETLPWFTGAAVLAPVRPSGLVIVALLYGSARTAS